MKNVYCLMLDGLDSIAVYKDTNVIGEVFNVNGEPSLSLTLYGTQTLSFNDLEIIMDNWNEMKELKTIERGERVVKIMEKELAKA